VSQNSDTTAPSGREL